MSTLKDLYSIIGYVPFGKECRKMLDDHANRITKSPGSEKKHQAWEGGYVDHLNETITLATTLYRAMSKIRPLPFTLSDAVLVLFWHDIEKPFKYVEPILCHDDSSFKAEILKHYGIKFTEEQENAMKYIHGEGNDYSDHRVQLPLAAFVHMCDVASARIWFDQPPTLA